MTRARDPLGAWQRRMLAAVTGRACGARPRDLVTRSVRQTSGERLAVYAGSYETRLVDALGADYPAVRTAIGGEAFDAFAARYLRRRPSRSWDLAAFSSGFAGEFRQARWCGAVCDLAAFEQAVAEVFDGEGSEEGPALRRSDLARLRTGDAANVRLRPTPSLRLLELRHPVLAWYGALRRRRTSAATALPAPRPTFVAVFRRDFVVARHEISRSQHALLRALQKGATLAAAISAAAAAAGDENVGAGVRSWFREWGAAGVFGRLTPR